ncbi:hypothetical protein EDB86DRAFT_2836385 [Lactarius hatsudake]|nr:hypothetical protein EDB86DRAFT_2836385 [Lactarius hatsudake]
MVDGHYYPWANPESGKTSSHQSVPILRRHCDPQVLIRMGFQFIDTSRRMITPRLFTSSPSPPPLEYRWEDPLEHGDAIRDNQRTPFGEAALVHSLLKNPVDDHTQYEASTQLKSREPDMLHRTSENCVFPTDRGGMGTEVLERVSVPRRLGALENLSTTTNYELVASRRDLRYSGQGRGSGYFGTPHVGCTLPWPMGSPAWGADNPPTHFGLMPNDLRAQAVHRYLH